MEHLVEHLDERLRHGTSCQTVERTLLPNHPKIANLNQEMAPSASTAPSGRQPAVRPVVGRRRCPQVRLPATATVASHQPPAALALPASIRTSITARANRAAALRSGRAADRRRAASAGNAPGRCGKRGRGGGGRRRSAGSACSGPYAGRPFFGLGVGQGIAEELVRSRKVDANGKILAVSFETARICILASRQRELRERDMWTGGEAGLNSNKGGDPTAGSPTVTLLRLSPNQEYPIRHH